MNRKTVLIILISAVLFALTGCELRRVDINSGGNPTDLTGAAVKDWPENRLLTVNGIESDYREVLLYMLSAKEEAELLYGKGIWEKVLDENGNTYGELKKRQILEDFIDMKIVCAHASDYDIKLFEEENRDIADLTGEFIERVGKEKLVAYNISEELVKTLYTNNFLAGKVNEMVTLSVDVNIADEEARQITIQYFFKSKYKISAAGRKMLLDGNALKALKETMQELRNTAASKDNFKSLAEANTDAEGPVEMVIGTGVLEPSIETIVFSLKDGEISPVLETEEGYYVYKCVSAYDEDASQKRKEALIAERRENAFAELFDSWKKSSSVIIDNEKWNRVNP